MVPSIDFSRGVSVINMQDKNLACRDCGQEFVFEANKQEFFAQKGFTNEPVRCLQCRTSRKASRGEGAYTRHDRQIFAANCARCGKSTQMPFQLRDDRPVYCSDCYFAQRPARYERNRW